MLIKEDWSTRKTLFLTTLHGIVIVDFLEEIDSH